jgi:hypothetical protein
MSEHDQSRKFADKSAAIANETLQKGKAAVDQSVQAFEQTYSAMIEQMRDYNLKMIDIAQANTGGVFEFARQLSTAKSSSDLFELWTAHAQKQTAMLNEQIKELTALGKEVRWRKRRAVHAKRQPGFQASLLITPSVRGGRIAGFPCA